MFDIAPAELLVLGVVAIAVIPPKDLPRALRTAGHWVGKVRGVARQFRSGFDEIIRESEVHEMEKRWRAENERIMREHPATAFQDLTAEPVVKDEPQGAVPVPAPAPAPADHREDDDYREVAPVPPIEAAVALTPRPAVADERRERWNAGGELPPLDRST